MATSTPLTYSLKTVVYLKRKEEELTDLLAFFKELPPADHGLHGYIKKDVLERLAPCLTSHTFCLYIKLRDKLSLLGIASLASLTAHPETPEWAIAAQRADLGIGYLEREETWLTDEILLAIADFKKHGLLAKPTAAPEQLLLQWYLERLEEALYRLSLAPPPISEEDLEQVEETFQAGRRYLALTAGGSA